ncbi:hypothetical protein CcI156_16680 [Frankia sp. CcI156]|jgi:hypothetical protein|uniref:Integral membrane protein n=1 Tax=Frankia casuarinae (strain DSM 45818 / CECT 9043 / HFP020203 / CcI3) TaxID=106370 RepID=Q2J895_FRACC|nr:MULTISPECIES: DUF4191 domain-containing protein [Frankia]ABD12497.1 hypothetical protein Francci3_3140 [Frankia casuarinae]ETA00454.1 hypothetical protein CcI6DRAFT_04141 [Frankia sp. CcI6]EYT91175.1 hypothetical protein ThrDRAFT_03194 [Frankia casuarinae]KDA42322.1 hypothetical protein BMG523Draft_02839 [Frankia sp. BMG5.23]KEZ36362.1 protein of unknown function (DUF4191) [Frankia sp. CeD]
MALKKKPTDAPGPAAPGAAGKDQSAGAADKNGAAGRRGTNPGAAGKTPGAAGKGGAAGRNGRSGEAGPGKGFTTRVAQLRMIYKVTRQRDPRALWITLAGFLAPVAVGIVPAIFVGPLYLWIPIALLLGVVVSLNLFSRRVQRTAYAEMEGKPGAAAGVIERMRGEWRLTPAVGVNRHQDVVHRVVCRAGVVIIAEGHGRGPRELLAAEKRRIRKAVGDTPVTDIIIGTSEGETPLPKLQSTLMRLRRTLRRSEVDALDRRLRAMGGAALPIPKGPIPRNIPRGGRIR